MDQLQGLFFNLNPMDPNTTKDEPEMKKEKSEDLIDMSIVDLIIDPMYFDPEIETGNCEYKLLLKPDNFRFQHLLTQMNWRIKEGTFSKAFYNLVC